MVEHRELGEGRSQFCGLTLARNLPQDFKVENLPRIEAEQSAYACWTCSDFSGFVRPQVVSRNLVSGRQSVVSFLDAADVVPVLVEFKQGDEVGIYELRRDGPVQKLRELLRTTPDVLSGLDGR